MGYFDDVNGPTSAPVIKLAENEMTRIRVVPAPEHTKYGKATKQFQHSPPREQELLFGGYCSILCIGARSGCIFHDEPYKWKPQLKIPINVIEYEVDKSNRLTGNRFIKLWIIGPRILDGLKSQLAMNNIEMDAIANYDLFLKRSGSKQTTSYAVSIAPQTIEAQIEWNFPSQGDFGDDEYPFLVDFNKLFGFEEMTPSEQQTWLAERIEKGREKMTNGESTPELPGYALPPTSPSSFGAPAGGFAASLPPSFGSVIGDNVAKANHHQRPDPWGQGRTFGQLAPHELEHVVNTPGHHADDVKAAKALIAEASAPVAPPPAPAPQAPAPPPAAPGGFTTGNFAAASAPAATNGFAAPAPPANAPAAPFTAPAAAFPTGVVSGFPATPAPAAAPQAAPAPVGFPGVPAPAAVPVAALVNPKKLAVDTAIQNHRSHVLANHDDMRRFLGVWGVKSTAEATDEHLDQMAGVLAAPPAEIIPWLAQYPVPA